MGSAGGASPLRSRDGGGALEAVRRRDEILSLLYWLRADRLSAAPPVSALTPFLWPVPPEEAELRALAEAGLIERLDGAGERRLRLTDAGLAEGRRRFEEEIEPAPADGTAGNAHQVIVGVCGPNTKCVREGTHESCASPYQVRSSPSTASGPTSASAG